MELYLSIEKELEVLAKEIELELGSSIVLEGDGLNIGNGQYFQYEFEDQKYILCRCNGDFEVDETERFQYLIYCRGGDKKELTALEPYLYNLGIEYEFGDYIT